MATEGLFQITDASSQTRTNGICNVVVLVHVLLSYLSCTVILEITQTIRGKHDKNVSDWMLIAFIAISCAFFLVLTKKMSTLLWTGIQNDRQQNINNQEIDRYPRHHRWKVVPIIGLGTPACIAFAKMIEHNGVNRYVAIGYLILSICQIVLFVLTNWCSYHENFHNGNPTWTISLGLSCNIGVLIHLIWDEFQEEPQKDLFMYLFPFRQEFVLFCFLLWLDFVPKGSQTAVNVIRSPVAISEHNNTDLRSCRIQTKIVITIVCSIVYILIPIAFVPICIICPENVWNNIIIIALYILLFTHFFFFNILFLRKMANIPEPDINYFAKDELLLTVCGVIFNIYFLSLLIPDIDSWMQGKSNEFTNWEVFRVGLGLLFIILQTQIILRLRRKDKTYLLTLTKNEQRLFRWMVRSMIIANIMFWLANCVKKGVKCGAWASNDTNRVYWLNVMKITYPVGIFYMFHSFQLLIECYLEFTIHT